MTTMTSPRRQYEYKQTIKNLHILFVFVFLYRVHMIMSTEDIILTPINDIFMFDS